MKRKPNSVGGALAAAREESKRMVEKVLDRVKSESDGGTFAVIVPKTKRAPNGCSGCVILGAPSWGTFWQSNGSGDSMHVKEGDKVVRGDRIGVFERIKMFEDIVSPIAGTVVKVVAKDGKVVTEGAPLMWVRPDAKDISEEVKTAGAGIGERPEGSGD